MKIFSWWKKRILEKKQKFKIIPVCLLELDLVSCKSLLKYLSIVRIYHWNFAPDKTKFWQNQDIHCTFFSSAKAGWTLNYFILAILADHTALGSSGWSFYFKKAVRAYLPLTLFSHCFFTFLVWPLWILLLKYMKRWQTYKKMRGSSIFVRLDWLILTDLHYNNDTNQSTYWSDNEVEVIRV